MDITDCVIQLAKASDIYAVGHGFEPRPTNKIGIKIIFRSDHT